MSSVGLSGTLTKSVFMYVYMRTCVFVYLYLHVRQLGTLILRSSYHYIFENISYSRHICNFNQCSICVIVFLHICICMSDKWVLCLRSSYLFKNIAHVGPLCNFYRSCICVFVGETLGNIVFEVLVP